MGGESRCDGSFVRPIPSFSRFLDEAKFVLFSERPLASGNVDGKKGRALEGKHLPSH